MALVPERDHYLVALILRSWQELLKESGDRVYEEHRLSYTYDDDDTPDGDGKPTQLFVCRCREGFDRRAFNAHIRDAYKGVLDGQTTQR